MSGVTDVSEESRWSLSEEESLCLKPKYGLFALMEIVWNMKLFTFYQFTIDINFIDSLLSSGIFKGRLLQFRFMWFKLQLYRLFMALSFMLSSCKIENFELHQLIISQNSFPTSVSISFALHLFNIFLLAILSLTCSINSSLRFNGMCWIFFKYCPAFCRHEYVRN